MDNHQLAVCVPQLSASEAQMSQRPWIDNFSPGYFQRMFDFLPKQGSHAPWVNTQNYKADKKLLLKGQVDDGVMVFK